MSKQPEALRLADLLQDECGVDGYVHDQAAAELRRLHALLEAEQELHQRVTYPELRRLRAQRAALLEALKGLMSEEPNIYEGRLEASLYVTVDALEAAHAAIKAVEGEKT